MSQTKENKKALNIDILDKYSWPQITRFLLIVMVIYALGSVFIANPFMYRIGKESVISYSNIMYAHGLTVGLASIVCLVTCQIFDMSNRVRKYILFFAVVGVIIGVIAGAFNRSIDPPYWLWFQVLSFFALDAVFASLIIGFIYVKNNELRHSLTYWLGLVASISFLIAGITGDIAGWILDFGEWPSIIPWWARFVGFESVPRFMSRLIRAHSHIMIASLFSTLIVIISWKYGRLLTGSAVAIKKTGESLVLLGLLLADILFLIDGYGGPLFQTPKVFTSAPLTDLVVSIGIMGGGTLVIVSIYFGKRASSYQPSAEKRAAITSISLTWILMFLILSGIGVMMDLNASLWNSHGNGVLAENGFSYRFLHQDLTFLLFPAVIIIMILIQHWLSPQKGKMINILLRSGVVLSFLGAMLYVLLIPELKGPGYWVISAGFLLIIISMFYFLLYGKFNKDESAYINKND